MAALGELGARHGASFFLVATAAYHAFLTRLTGESDVVLGVPLAGRRHPATRGQLGYFIKALPVRVDAGGDPSFLELLARVRERHLEAWKHEAIPLERLAAELLPDRQLGRNPFFDLAFQVRDGYFGADLFPVSRPSTCWCTTAPANSTSTSPWCAAAKSWWPRSNTTSSFSTGPASTCCSSKVSLCSKTPRRRPHSRLSELAMLPERQRAILAGWNATAGSAPLETSLAALFRAAAAANPAAPALEYGDATAGDLTIVSYAELDRRSDVLALALREAGVAPGDFVAFAMERSHRQIAALLAIVKAGAAYCRSTPATRPNGCVSCSRIRARGCW